MDSLTPSSADASSAAGGHWRSVLADRVVCAAAGLLALGVYLATLAPGVTGEDSGELIAAAWTLGIPHPPGYPLWCLLAYPVLHAIDVGSVAWRGNLVSAIFGAAGVWLVAETVLALFGRRAAALTAALVLAFSREYWQQSVAAEVYTLGAALVAVHLLLLVRWSRSRRSATLYAAALAAGLAAAHYSLNAVLIALGLVYVFALDLRPRRFRRYLYFLALTLPGWAIYLYLPLRSLAGPAMDWGNPETWSNFIDVVTRRQYRELMLAPGVFGPELAGVLRDSWRQLAREFTPWVGLAALAGMAAWTAGELGGRGRSARSAPFAAYAVTATLLFAAGALLGPNYPAEYHWSWLRTPYWLPALLMGSFFIGYITSTFVYINKFIYISVCIFFILSVGVVNFSHNIRRDDRIVETYAEGLLEGMAPDAVYFGGGDHTLFPAVYLQVVEGRRPDVLLANRYGYPAPELFVLAGEPAPAARPSEDEEQRLFEAVLARTLLPVYSAVPRAAPNATRVNEGLLYRYLRGDETHRPVGPEEIPIAVTKTRGDWSNELVAHEYLAARGRALFDADRPAEALEALDRAAGYVHEDKEALNNLGLNAAEGGQVAAAAVYFQRALATDPLFLPPALNLARCYLIQGTPREALRVVDRMGPAGIKDPRLDEIKRAALDALEGH